MPTTKTTIDYAIALSTILVLNFILPRLLPGDPLQAIYGDEALMVMTPAMQTELIHRFALDQTWSEQFVAYIQALLRADLGYSYFYHTSVVSVIAGVLPWTLLLTGLAFVLSTLLGSLLGIESGFQRSSKQDGHLLGIMMFISGFPDFFAGIVLLLIFGVWLAWLPLSGALTPYSGFTGLKLVADIAQHLTLPLAALVLVRMTAAYLFSRGAMVGVMGESFIRTARAKGCPDIAIRYRHAARSALLPMVTAAGLSFTHVVSNVLFIETVFSYPGLGSLLYKAVLTRDYPLLQGILLLAAVLVLVVNFVTDLLCARLDPRLSVPSPKVRRDNRAYPV
ncbi:Glutathione transport system permease protein GsiC [Sporomusa ovata DSM 2662]|uniref:Oligopeptide transport system permease protein OppB (TC 3.A.1.5.1) n=1 Tax=Sporomusa ovata TaxID=2378 RepID=A0A0U1KRU6_9FIRM|nr:ABC transporter permease subunit [Sporomusa ovata]EQB24937.1 ABC-type dipeptide/oligopeptide/nickel transport system, permease component [Sporomusa ovata DSM 2662]CQR70132.1 Oligopeptide transport system permease protein OppB (TC 3.A.1.5.1) [Sporomusa ovata]